MTKVCKGCGRELPISKFARDDRMLDGHLNYCNPCRHSRSSWKDPPRVRRRKSDELVSLGQKPLKRPTTEPRKSVCEAIEYIRKVCREQGYITTKELLGIRIFVRRDAISWLTDNDTFYEDDSQWKPEWYSFLWANNPKIVDKQDAIV